MYACVHIDTCTDTCIDMCVDMCLDMCIGVRVGVCIDGVTVAECGNEEIVKQDITILARP